MARPWFPVLVVSMLLFPVACSGSSNAPTGGTIRIGTLHPLTGSYAGDGRQLENGAELAVKAINDAGGIKALGGAKLALEPGDTQGKPDVGQSEAQRLTQAGAVALIGTYQSAVAQNVAAVAERGKVPFVMNVAAEDKILQQGLKYSFRVQPVGSKFAVQAADYLKALSATTQPKVTKIAYLHEQTNFGRNAYQAFKAQAEKNGFTVDPEISYDAATVSDLTTQITQVKASGAQVLAVTGYYRDGVLAAKAIASVQPQLQAVLGVADGAFDHAQFVTDVGSAANGFLNVNYGLNLKNQEAVTLQRNYQQAHNQPMRTEAGLAYDTVQVIAAAIEKAGSSDPAKIRDAIAQTALPPVTTGGPIKFDDKGENTGAVPVLQQGQSGKVTVVLPEEEAQVKPVFPVTPGQ
ncbi:branched-chain amino acid transport system substrate-binding protein [Kibdelosporangium banguiense]|uniref:Branched-chain amino acid transport system substrate-binding protein n=1 Tax=Kibdelosporangium banguiense TaxID=1365924 RepID=A0ABS4TSV9_9PSEU|nr:ABC transporter substrate-binding protein [Kibdelosporangium banguiense]MBP2327035.1 branched-chain amino acid transport system substrate-binding protein [Kibdelosporangium banguiense]